MMPGLDEQLKECFRGRVCLMGLGNEDYGDDGLGSVLSEAVAGRLNGLGDTPGRHEAINAQTAPERFIDRVYGRGFDHIIFVDAVEFGAAPGSVIFLGSGEMAGRFPQISTHKLSPGLLAGWIEAGGTTKAWLLGVQPGSLKPARGLTKDVQVTSSILEEMLWGLCVSEDPCGSCGFADVEH